jgi:hypothetical protein
MNPKLILCLALVLGGDLFADDTGIRLTTYTTLSGFYPATSGFTNLVVFLTNTVSGGVISPGTNTVTSHLPGGFSQLFIQNKDVFTRNGQTNLVRFSESTNGITIVYSHHIFYHDGKPVGDCLGTDPRFIQIDSEAGSRYSIRYRSGGYNEPLSIYILETNGDCVDLFRCTNGLFYPVESRLIKSYNFWRNQPD